MGSKVENKVYHNEVECFTCHGFCETPLSFWKPASPDIAALAHKNWHFLLLQPTSEKAHQSTIQRILGAGAPERKKFLHNLLQFRLCCGRPGPGLRSS